MSAKCAAKVKTTEKAEVEAKVNKAKGAAAKAHAKATANALKDKAHKASEAAIKGWKSAAEKKGIMEKR